MFNIDRHYFWASDKLCHFFCEIVIWRLKSGRFGSSSRNPGSLHVIFTAVHTNCQCVAYMHVWINAWLNAHTLTHTYVHTSAWACMKLASRRLPRWILPLANFTQALTPHELNAVSAAHHNHTSSLCLDLLALPPERSSSRKGLPGCWSEIRWHSKNNLW